VERDRGRFERDIIKGCLKMIVLASVLNPNETRVIYWSPDLTAASPTKSQGLSRARKMSVGLSFPPRSDSGLFDSRSCWE